ncbi:MAG: Nif11-like leader peptide family natural product precursor [Planctomycetota bacterium]
MSKKDVERFAADVKKDATLAAEVKKIGANVAAIVKFAKDKGYSFSAAELKDAAKAKKSQLTEEQLKKVAGGSVVAVVTVVVEVA